MRSPRILTLSAGVLGLSLATGCGVLADVGAPTDPDAQSQAGEASPVDAQSADPEEFSLRIKGHDALGEVMADNEGYTLYRYDEDSPGAGDSACYGECAEQWQPVESLADMTFPGDTGLLGSITRSDGTEQVTLDGWPLYRYAGDESAEDVTGEGVDDSWYAASPVGSKAQDEGWTEGYCPAGFQLWEHPELGTIVTDDQGFTLYRFEEDSPDPSEATCLGDCAETWPPVLNMAEFTTDGVDPDLLGSVEREGRLDQVTLGGWPLYRFSGDEAAGDVNGHGANDDSFHAVTPTGAIAGEQEQAEDPDEQGDY